MPFTEFDIIREYFSQRGPSRPDVACGIGDDGAVLQVPAGKELVVALDTLVAGVHFPLGTAPFSIGYKALAVNLSDLAAMGAEPAWATLGLTLPERDRQWLAQFSAGLFALAESHGVQLIGGDTTRGPLTVTVQAHGFVPRGTAACRGAACAGDDIYVTGTLGDAGLALLAVHGRYRVDGEQGDYLRGRLEQPTPRVMAGQALREMVHGMVDVSDGLLADLGHILAASGVGARLAVEQLPFSEAMLAARAQLGERHCLELALSAGDDYELCFTAAKAQREEIARVFAALDCRCTRVGVIEPGSKLVCEWADGQVFRPARSGYEHFG